MAAWGHPTGALRNGKPVEDRSWRKGPAWEPSSEKRFKNLPPGKVCIFDASNLSPQFAFPRHLIRSLDSQPPTRVTLKVPKRDMDVRLLAEPLVKGFYNPQKIDLLEILKSIPRNVESVLASARSLGMSKGEFYFDKAKINKNEVDKYHAGRLTSNWEGVSFPRFWVSVTVAFLREARDVRCHYAVGMDNDDLVATRTLFDSNTIMVSSDRDFCMYRARENNAQNLNGQVYKFFCYQIKPPTPASRRTDAPNRDPANFMIDPYENIVLQSHLIKFYPKKKKDGDPKDGDPKDDGKYHLITSMDTDDLDARGLRSRNAPFITNPHERHVLLMRSNAWPFHVTIDIREKLLPLRLAVYETLCPNKKLTEIHAGSRETFVRNQPKKNKEVWDDDSEDEDAPPAMAPWEDAPPGKASWESTDGTGSTSGRESTSEDAACGDVTAQECGETVTREETVTAILQAFNETEGFMNPGEKEGFMTPGVKKGSITPDKCRELAWKVLGVCGVEGWGDLDREFEDCFRIATSEDAAMPSAECKARCIRNQIIQQVSVACDWLGYINPVFHDLMYKILIGAAVRPSDISTNAGAHASEDVGGAASSHEQQPSGRGAVAGAVHSCEQRPSVGGHGGMAAAPLILASGPVTSGGVAVAPPPPSTPLSAEVQKESATPPPLDVHFGKNQEPTKQCDQTLTKKLEDVALEVSDARVVMASGDVGEGVEGAAAPPSEQKPRAGAGPVSVTLPERVDVALEVCGFQVALMGYQLEVVVHLAHVGAPVLLAQLGIDVPRPAALTKTAMVAMFAGDARFRVAGGMGKRTVALASG